VTPSAAAIRQAGRGRLRRARKKTGRGTWPVPVLTVSCGALGKHLIEQALVRLAADPADPRECLGDDGPLEEGPVLLALAACQVATIEGVVGVEGLGHSLVEEDPRVEAPVVHSPYLRRTRHTARWESIPINGNNSGVTNQGH